MPARAALSAGLLVSALWLGGCSQPGTQVPLAAAKKLDEATSAIAVSCGYAEQTAAFGGPNAPGLARLEASAAAGARKLVSVLRQVPTDVYQGETVSQIVSDSVELLGQCGLSRAQHILTPAGR